MRSWRPAFIEDFLFLFVAQYHHRDSFLLSAKISLIAQGSAAMRSKGVRKIAQETERSLSDGGHADTTT